ncbi:MAG: GTP pyrophosphokinase [Clostridia bacterium]|nr:GTP pyrophosphokinase [Clostridia bacterium]
MLYTELTKKAMKIAFDAHKEQVDKNGIPYIYHPVHLAEQMNTEYEICVAFLHDTVEDCDVTFDDLIEAGFPDEVVEALKLMTHDKSVPYMEYVRKIKNNPIAKAVKLADLRHNSDLTRLDHVTEKDLIRKKKYEQAIRLLSSLD